MKRLISVILTMSIVFILVINLNTNSLATTSGSDITTLKISVKYGQTEARSMLSMINKFRTGSDAWYWNSDNKTKTTLTNLDTLTYDYSLEKIAMQRAAEIALSFSHTRPNGEMCYTCVYDDTRSWGENIAVGYLSAKTVFKGWQEANEKYLGQGHRRNMLSGYYKSIGIGHVYYNGNHYWVQEFSSKITNTKKTTANDKTTTASVDLLSSMITGYTVGTSETSLKVNNSSTKAIPSIQVYANITGAWSTSRCPIKISGYTWKISNTSYAKISGSKVKGLKVGKTNLTTTVLGKNISIPVTVIPSKVTGLKAKSQTKTSIKLNWTKVKDATGYIVYKYNTKTKTYKKVATVKTNSYNVKGLTAATSYKFKVVAYQKVDGKTYTGTYSNVLKTATKTKTPTISKITTKSKKATIKWKKVSGATGYQVYMSTSKNGNYKKIKNITKSSTVSYTKSSLKKSKKYYFKVRAYKTVDGKKVYSSFSTVKSIKIK